MSPTSMLRASFFLGFLIISRAHPIFLDASTRSLSSHLPDNAPSPSIIHQIFTSQNAGNARQLEKRTDSQTYTMAELNAAKMRGRVQGFVDGYSIIRKAALQIQSASKENRPVLPLSAIKSDFDSESYEKLLEYQNQVNGLKKQGSSPDVALKLAEAEAKSYGISFADSVLLDATRQVGSNRKNDEIGMFIDTAKKLAQKRLEGNLQHPHTKAHRETSKMIESTLISLKSDKL